MHKRVMLNFTIDIFLLVVEMILIWYYNLHFRRKKNSYLNYSFLESLTLKVPITTAVDDILKFFLCFREI